MSPPQEGSGTWAERNPTKDIINPGQRTKSSATTATRKLALDELNIKIEEIARTHSRKVKYIQWIVKASTSFTKKRAPSLHNALAHFKSAELNENLPAGERLRLAELQRLAKEDPNLQDMTPEKKDELIAGLEEYRATKAFGARPSNVSAAKDVRATVDRISYELDNLAERTGTHAIAFITRGHVNDTMEPEWLESGCSMDFLRETYNMDPWDITRSFEQWACSRAKNGEARDTLALVRAECTKMILSGLRFATKAKDMVMNYANYETSIVERHKVKLVGWTFSQLVSPSEIGAMSDIRKLRDALKSGSCKWVRLSKREVIGKKRKERSDKGKKRPRKPTHDSDTPDPGSDNGSDVEEDRPQKKKKKSVPSKKLSGHGRKASKAVGQRKVKRAPAKSKAIVSDTEDESGDD